LVLSRVVSSQRPAVRWWNGAWAAMIVVLCFGALALGGASSKGVTYDELGHVTAGAAAWRFHDLRLQPENGLLPERLAGLPSLLSGATFPSRDQPAWADSDVWALGRQFFFEVGNDSRALLFGARAMIVLLALALGLGVYAWSRAIFGPTGGMLSVLAFALAPALRAHGALATSDLAAAAALLLGTALLARVVRRVTPGRVLASGAAVGLALLAKHSGLLLLPVAGVLAGLQLLSREGLHVAGFGRATTVFPRLARAGVLLAVALAHVALAVLVLWCAYGFRQSAFAPAPASVAEHELSARFYSGGWEHIEAAAHGGPGAAAAGPALSTALFLQQHRLLPEAWLYGFCFVLVHSTDRASYLDGEVRYGGFPDFFPRAFACKTPLGLALLVLVAAAVLWARRDRALLAAVTPLLVLVAVVWAAALATRLNIGDRHLLPALVPLLVLCGAAAFWLTRAAARAAVLALLLLYGVESLSNWPDDLAFFNVAAGGPSNGWRHLADSSLDWGQDLPGLSRWLSEHVDGREQRPPVFLSYFGKDSPAATGLDVTLLPGVPDVAADEPLAPLTGGVYCIGATMISGLYTPLPAPWSLRDEQLWVAAQQDMAVLDAARSDRARFDAFIAQRGAAYWSTAVQDFKQLRFARLCASLRRREPDAQVGHSILVWELSDDDVNAALWGPPVELLPDPLPARR